MAGLEGDSQGKKQNELGWEVNYQSRSINPEFKSTL